MIYADENISPNKSFSSSNNDSDYYPSNSKLQPLNEKTSKDNNTISGNKNIKKYGEVEYLRRKLDISDSELRQVRISLQESEEREIELENYLTFTFDELKATSFMNSIHEQRICELEEIISQNRMEHNEELASRAKKQKHALKKVNEEKIEYEKRANFMVTQLNEQMSQLQKMAMQRIEVILKKYCIIICFFLIIY
jgi:hypothetical protein